MKAIFPSLRHSLVLQSEEKFQLKFYDEDAIIICQVRVCVVFVYWIKCNKIYGSISL